MLFVYIYMHIYIYKPKYIDIHVSKPLQPSLNLLLCCGCHQPQNI